jgi:hypothetical protein
MGLDVRNGAARFLRGRLAAFYMTKGLSVTAHGKKEARPAMAKAAQGKA